MNVSLEHISIQLIVLHQLSALDRLFYSPLRWLLLLMANWIWEVQLRPSQTDDPCHWSIRPARNKKKTTA